MIIVLYVVIDVTQVLKQPSSAPSHGRVLRIKHKFDTKWNPFAKAHVRENRIRLSTILALHPTDNTRQLLFRKV